QEVIDSQISFTVVAAVFMGYADDLANRVTGHQQSDPLSVCIKAFRGGLQLSYSTRGQEPIIGSCTEVFLAKVVYLCPQAPIDAGNEQCFIKLIAQSDITGTAAHSMSYVPCGPACSAVWSIIHFTKSSRMANACLLTEPMVV